MSVPRPIKNISTYSFMFHIMTNILFVLFIIFCDELWHSVTICDTCVEIYVFFRLRTTAHRCELPRITVYFCPLTKFYIVYIIVTILPPTYVAVLPTSHLYRRRRLVVVVVVVVRIRQGLVSHDCSHGPFYSHFHINLSATITMTMTIGWIHWRHRRCMDATELSQ